MDYEKKYNEALERAKKIHDEILNNELLGFPDQIREIFPELRESEDERIRKAIIRSIEEDSSVYEQEVSKEQMLAYLEKQKYDRMKPIYDARESFESALEKAWNDYHNGYENVDKLEDDYVECAHAKGFREGYLFGIEKQKEQKPAEWNEEETKDLVHILKVLDDCYAYGKHDLSKTDHDNLTSMLKSLRPSWKPSEEQMKALLNAEGFLRAGLQHDSARTIAELYEQLKKLGVKEEPEYYQHFDPDC